MKHGANRLVEHLLKQDISAMAIHGNKSQSARTKALADFKSGDLQVLVATDIAARGIDIDQLPHVVNFELPNVPEDYVHRIGRTGRAGAQGEAVSLVCVDENGFLREIEKLIKREIPKEIIEGFAPHPSEKPEPIVLGRMVIGEGAGRGGRSGGGARPAGGGGGGGRGGRPGGGGGGGQGGDRGRGAPAARAGGPAPRRDGGAPAGGGRGPASPARAGAGGGGGRGGEPRRDGGRPSGRPSGDVKR
jgi:ATP-dependent RNA helicase RhlE